MVYTEIKERNGKKYYYRVISVRNGKKITKRRNYLGVNLLKNELSIKELNADKQFYLIKSRKSLEKIKPEILKILKKNNIKKAGIFGSYARGENKKESDIDIVIKPTKNMGFGFAGIKIELEEKLKKKVDLLTYNSIHPLLRKIILSEEIRII